MTPLKYLDAVKKILAHLETTQLPAIEKAADLVAESLSHGGAVFCSEIGHGGQGDFINRAGGLMAVQPFTCNLNISDRVPRCHQNRPQTETVERDLETIRLAVRVSNLRAGDVIVTSSVSGKNRGPIELALACKSKGLKTIGFSSLEYTGNVSSLHPSGKKLCEVVDVAVDIGAPYGDAAVDIPGYDHKLLPVSGVSMGVIGHMIFGRVMEKMAAAGNPPTVLMSFNREGGPDAYKKAVEQYETRGY
jgi:uncharacterized phosphosugar-binding protein